MPQALFHQEFYKVTKFKIIGVNAIETVTDVNVPSVIILRRISELRGSIYFCFGLYMRRAMSQVWWRRYSDSSSYWLKENSSGEVRPPCGDGNAEGAGFLVALGFCSPHCPSYHSHVQGGTDGHGSRFEFCPAWIQVISFYPRVQKDAVQSAQLAERIPRGSQTI